MAAALNFDTAEYQQIRKQALEFVSLLLKRGAFAEASALADRVSEDKTFFQNWIESAAILLQDIYYASKATERVGNRDLLTRLQDIARNAANSTILGSIEALRKLKYDLQFNVNRQIALEALFIGITRRP